MVAPAQRLCQKVNTSWDTQIRSAFQNFLLYLFTLCILLVTTISVIQNNIFTVTLISIIAQLFPIAFYFFKRQSENKDTMVSLDKLSDKAELLLERVLNIQLDIENEPRKLQNDIYKHRINALLIWDWFYFIYRPKQEGNMSESAKIIIEEYLSQRNEKLMVTSRKTFVEGITP
jgi:hypothetical protein